MCLSSPTTHPLTPSHRLCPLGTISYHFWPLADSLIFTAPIFAGISAVEPIFHLETLAGTLDDTNPDKKPFLSLVKLGRLANIFAGSPERAPLSATIEQLDTLLLEYRFVPFSVVLTIY